MDLTHLEIKNFRNFENLKIDFSPKINIFLGRNAQGKTNLLEAVNFLGLTRSHRSSNDKELIKFGQKYAELSGHVQKSQVKVDLKVRISKKGKKVWINNLEQKKLSNYVGKLNTILFSPEDLFLIKGSPNKRRRFMNLEFGQINYEYLYFTSQYRQVLQQKNNYLKKIASKKTTDRVFLEVLSDQLAGIAAEVVKRRFEYLTKLSVYATKAYQALSNGQEKLTIKYLPSIANLERQDTIEELYNKILANYQAEMAKEIKMQVTLAGPHRDDVQFLLNKRNAHVYASQGQQRTIALSLKLAQVDLVHELTNEYPILLLDDVMSELDSKRQESLLEYIKDKTQTFITTTNLEGISQEIISSPKIFTINAGQVEKKENTDG